jgi:hypothetical protein
MRCSASFTPTLYRYRYDGHEWTIAAEDLHPSEVGHVPDFERWTKVK